MKFISILVIVLFALCCCASTSSKYKEAPLPHYNLDKGYGWQTTVPIDKPKNVWNILKAWEFPGKIMLFVDKNKDGKCDIVINLRKTGKYTDKGIPYVIRTYDQSCQNAEKEIYEFRKKEGEIL